MNQKKEEFLKEVIAHGCAVLVGPLLGEDESKLIADGPLCLVDGGADLASKYALTASRTCFVVGDGDSSNAQMDEKLSCEKDFSDLSYTLNMMPKDLRKFKLFGFLGGRKDHELINFGEVHHFLLNKKDKTSVFFSKSLLFLSSGRWNLVLNSKDFSLMALEKAEVSLTGNIKYPIVKPSIMQPLSSQFLSNTAYGEFELCCDGPVLLYGEGIKLKEE